MHLYPGIRDYDGWVYFREWSGGLMAGGFEPKALPCFQDGIPDNFEFQLLPENWEQFRKFKSGLHNFPDFLFICRICDRNNPFHYLHSNPT